MKRLSILAAMAMAMASAVAEPSWAVLNTEGANGDTSGEAGRYTAYLCTVAAAEAYFGGNGTYSGITDYLKGSAANYGSGVANIAAGGSALSFYGYDAGEYSFALYEQPGTLGSDYVALVTYADGADSYFRVFGGSVANDRLVLDPGAGKGAAGAWTQAVVPEPTSGLLLLLGVAGLALKRKRGPGKCSKVQNA